eukprot:Sdes_comp18527_c0_seq1m8586
MSVKSNFLYAFGRSFLRDESSGAKIQLNSGIRQISCGDQHSGLIDYDGNLYMFGNNDYGQLGCGTTAKCDTPTKVVGFGSQRITSVSCGRNHTICCTEEGLVYSWGAGNEYQLGLGNQKDFKVPQKVENLQHVCISSVSSGANFSAALTQDGDVYLWGSSQEGQCGRKEEFVKYAEKLDFLQQ